MQLVETVGTWVLANLPYDRADPEVVAALKAKSAPELLVIYLNWRHRLITPQPRSVSGSAAFDANPMAKERQGTITEIIKDVEKGSLLTKYLSTGVSHGFVLPRNPKKKQLNRRKDLDLLLNDWGIHHLHVSTVVEADGFVERDGPIIFGIFRPERAYLIEIMNHGDWTSEHIIRVIMDTWPDEGLISELKGIVGIQNTHTDKVRAKLRGAGISTFISIDGRTFLPGTGLSTAGTSTAASITAGRVLRTLKNFEEQANANPDKIVELIRQHGGHIAGKLAFVFSVFDDGFGVSEINSGATIRLSQ